MAARNKNDLGFESFAKRLCALRKERNMSQLRLAERLGVTRSTVANWECGTRHPLPKYIEQLSHLFGVPADYLYGLSDRRYKIDTRDYFELDLTKLNSTGKARLYENYKLLLLSDEYRAK